MACRRPVGDESARLRRHRMVRVVVDLAARDDSASTRRAVRRVTDGARSSPGRARRGRSRRDPRGSRSRAAASRCRRSRHACDEGLARGEILDRVLAQLVLHAARHPARFPQCAECGRPTDRLLSRSSSAIHRANVRPAANSKGGRSGPWPTRNGAEVVGTANFLDATTVASANASACPGPVSRDVPDDWNTPYSHTGGVVAAIRRGRMERETRGAPADLRRSA